MAGESNHASDVASEARRDQRSRAAIPFEIALLGVPGAPVQRVLSSETGTGGMSFFSRRQFRLGEPVAIKFPFLNGGRRLVLAVVRNSGEAHAGFFRTGVEFIEAVTLPSSRLVIPEKWQREIDSFLARTGEKVG